MSDLHGLRVVMEAQKISAKRLSEALGVRESTMSSIIAGRYPLTVRNRRRICRIFGQPERSFMWLYDARLVMRKRFWG